MVQKGYKPDFWKYVQFGLKTLEILDCFKEKTECASFLDPTILLGLMLYIFTSWLYHDKVVAGTSNKDSSQKFTNDGSSSPVRDTLGTKFVIKYLHKTPRMTLLHYSLTNFVITSDSYVIDNVIHNKYRYMGYLIEALLEWGCYRVIDMPNWRGLRPIHVAARTEDLPHPGIDNRGMVSALLKGGAHADAVTREGETLHDICTNPSVVNMLHVCGPVDLVCLAARCIVLNELSYHLWGLPAHLVSFVELHDKNSIQ